MRNPTAVATFMHSTDRLEAAYELRSRAIQWAIACSGTPDILAAYELVQWAYLHHAAMCAA